MTNKFENLHMQSNEYLVELVLELRGSLLMIAGGEHELGCPGVFYDDKSDEKLCDLEFCECNVKTAKEALGE